jgi:hypothetical protein
MRIETVLNGVRTELFASGKEPPLDLDVLAGLPAASFGVVRIGLVATYASWKGHHLFLEAARRIALAEPKPGIFLIALRFGFRETPDVPKALEAARPLGLDLEPMDTSYFVARTFVGECQPGMRGWRSRLFGWMNRQSEGVAPYYKLPANRVVELGTQLA